MDNVDNLILKVKYVYKALSVTAVVKTVSVEVTIHIAELDVNQILENAELRLKHPHLARPREQHRRRHLHHQRLVPQ